MAHTHDIACLSELTPGGKLYCKATGVQLLMGGGKINEWRSPPPPAPHVEPKTPYYMSGRGQSYRLTDEGWIKRMDMPFTPSPSWTVVAVVQRWNAHPKYGINDWPALKRELDAGKTVTGYLYDRDHGSLRMWGGSYGGRIPKVTIRKVG
jgi:hypothetical protein